MTPSGTGTVPADVNELQKQHSPWCRPQDSNNLPWLCRRPRRFFSAGRGGCSRSQCHPLQGTTKRPADFTVGRSYYCCAGILSAAASVSCRSLSLPSAGNAAAGRILLWDHTSRASISDGVVRQEPVARADTRVQRISFRPLRLPFFV